MTDLRDVIARAIFLVDYMSMGEESWGTAALDGNDDRRQAFEKADAVLAVLADHDATVRAEALREAAEGMRGCKLPGHWNLSDELHPEDVAYSPDRWLEVRADRIEQDAEGGVVERFAREVEVLRAENQRLRRIVEVQARRLAEQQIEQGGEP